MRPLKGPVTAAIGGRSPRHGGRHLPQAHVDRGHVAPAHSAGPGVGSMGQLTLLGKRHWAKKRFHAEITAADAGAGFTYRLI